MIITIEDKVDHKAVKIHSFGEQVELDVENQITNFLTSNALIIDPNSSHVPFDNLLSYFGFQNKITNDFHSKYEIEAVFMSLLQFLTNNLG